MDEEKVSAGPDVSGAAVPVAPENSNVQPASTTEAVKDETSEKVESSAMAMETEKVESPEKEKVTLEIPKTEQKTTNMDESVDADDSSKATSRAPTPTGIVNNSCRKVIIQNVYKYVDKKKVEKMAAAWFKDIQELSEEGFKIELEAVKKPPKENWTVLTLKDEAMVQPLIDYINNNGIANKKGSKLFAKIAEDKSGEVDDRKRKAGDSNDENANKRQRTARRPVTEDEVRDKVTPLWRKTTEQQLIVKSREMVKKCAMKIVQEVKGRFRSLEKERNREKLEVYDWVQQRRSIDCFDIISAPTPLRNKCEFTFGYRYLFKETDKDGNVIDVEADPESIPAVGFMATGWAGGVSRPDCCANIPAEACAMADIFDDFLSKSPLLPYDSKVHTGFWRTLTIRTSRRTMECMLIILHAPPVEKDGTDNSEHFVREKARLLSILTAAELPVPDQAPIKVTSIFFQEFDGQSSPSPEHPVQHAYGKEVLHERLGKCTFQISPGAFFQVNTAGAELLYQLVVDKVREVSIDPGNTLLFDVCCGTGTIGLTCMKEGAVGSVVGVDISVPAIEDAKINAELNGFGASGDSKKTTRFVAARAEQVLSAEIGKAKTSGLKFVAVVDPAREGLHADVVKTLRMNERITRIVYVSCNPTATLVRDAALLCGPPTKRYPGRAFLVESAKPVDMFPLTNHCEMVMTFDRLPYKSKASGDEVVKSKENGVEVKSKENGDEVFKSNENEAEVKSKENGDEVVKSNENEAEVKSNENEAEVKSKENGDEVVKSNENEAEVKSNENEAEVKSNENEAEVKPTEEEGKSNGDEDSGEKEIK